MSLDFEDGTDRLPVGRHRATLEEIEALLVEGFPDSATRGPLFASWRNLVAAIQRVVSVQAHWLDGSFVTTKQDPNDIDAVTHLDGALVDALDEVDMTLIKGLLSHKITEALHGCDSYLVVEYPEGHPGRTAYEAAVAYWDDWFGKDRDGNPKGYVELVMT